MGQVGKEEKPRMLANPSAHRGSAVWVFGSPRACLSPCACADARAVPHWAVPRVCVPAVLHPSVLLRNVPENPLPG